MNISIFGLGYVGAVSLACLARDGHRVVGVDIDQHKLDLIKSGQSPIIEEGMEDLVRSVAASGRVEVTTDAAEAVRTTEISFVCVGTPSLPNGSQDQSAILRLAEQLGQALRDKDDYHVVVIRSTIAPGLLRGQLVPLMEQHSGKRAGGDFGICFQPEFLREGSSIKDYDKPPFTVVGSDSERAVGVVRELFQHLPCEFVATSIESAEVLKYCCNVFHALKTTFANEIGRICQGLNVDSHEVMQLVCMDKQLNISTAYMRPGYAFGGSCLPKDMRALMKIAQGIDVDTPMLSQVMNSNRVHLEHGINQVLRTGKRHIGMVGLSFKSGTDDLRESPLVDMAEAFIGKGLSLEIYDPEVNVARLTGANKRYIEGSIPHIASLMRDTVESVIDEAEVIVLGLSDVNLVEAVATRSRAGQLVLDLSGALKNRAMEAQYLGVCW